MKSVNQHLHFAAHRFGIVAKAGGRMVKRKPSPLQGNSVDGGSAEVEVKEFATASGEVIARRVTTPTAEECWLRADLAEQARAALEEEAAGYARATAVVAEFISYTDEQGAARTGTTVEQYRAKRHAAGNRWDNYRAKQRAGGF